MALPPPGLVGDNHLRSAAQRQRIGRDERDCEVERIRSRDANDVPLGIIAARGGRITRRARPRAAAPCCRDA